jgi:hypothetical protein
MSSEPVYGFEELQAIGLHHITDDVATGTAPKAVERLCLIEYAKGCAFLFVEWAPAFVRAP